METRKTEKAQSHANLIESITTDIVMGVHQPGQWLKQVDLEKKYNSSRLNVRRALDVLLNKRLVEYLPNRGFRVFEPNPEYSKDVRAVRTLLETAAATSIIENCSKKDIVILKTLAENFSHHLKFGTLLEQSESNRAFHHKMTSLNDNKVLNELIDSMRQRGPSASVSARWKTHHQLEKSCNDHFLMVDAITAGDSKRLTLLIDYHINEKLPPNSERNTQS